MDKKVKISRKQLEEILVQELLNEAASDRRAARKAYKKSQKGKGKSRKKLGNAIAKFFGYTQQQADTLASLEQIEELGDLAMLAVLRQRYGEKIQTELGKVSSLLDEAREDAKALRIDEKFEEDFSQLSQTFYDVYDKIESFKSGGSFEESSEDNEGGGDEEGTEQPEESSDIPFVNYMENVFAEDPYAIFEDIEHVLALVDERYEPIGEQEEKLKKEFSEALASLSINIRDIIEALVGNKDPLIKRFLPPNLQEQDNESDRQYYERLINEITENRNSLMRKFIQEVISVSFLFSKISETRLGDTIKDSSAIASQFIEAIQGVTDSLVGEDGSIPPGALDIAEFNINIPDFETSDTDTPDEPSIATVEYEEDEGEELERRKQKLSKAKPGEEDFEQPPETFKPSKVEKEEEKDEEDDDTEEVGNWLSIDEKILEAINEEIRNKKHA
tara:strand:+ start:2673 stop:4010 length:1338 start_codon:yes stop_codon:yes gene_type:complete